MGTTERQTSGADANATTGTWDKAVEVKDGDLLVDGKVVTYSQAKTVAEVRNA